MAVETGREIKLIPGQTLCFQDQTNLYVAVGPMNYTLQATDVPLFYSKQDEAFQTILGDPSLGLVQSPVASEGAYIILGNPVKTDSRKHPDTGKKGSAVELEFGTTVVIPGPARFDLYPGQWAEVVPGHRLTTNQYLRLKVIDAKKAEENWNSAVFEIQVDPSFLETEGAKPDPEKKKSLMDKVKGLGKGKSSEEGKEKEKESDNEKDASNGGKTAVINPGDKKPSLITGKEMILKGSGFSFFIPPSGIEVLKDKNTGEYVREAVTLQQGQYCILQYEDGVQITVQGPSVVVPLPSQTFLESGGKKVFVPISLDENSGVYVKVLKNSTFKGKEYEAGEELFITGKDEKFVFPRPGEWQILEMDGKIIHHAAPVPPGQGRYLWDETESKVELVKGPVMCLPDPRTQRFVTRSLPLHIVQLLFPNSQKAMEVNKQRLQNQERTRGGEKSFLDKGLASFRSMGSVDKDYVPGVEPEVDGPPMSPISFDNNFDGAVGVQVWTNYAIKVTDSLGKSRVEVGPKTVLLEYDELVEVLEFSTGKPKDHGRIVKDVFLVVEGNHVSDIVSAITSDNVLIQIPLSYRLNFEGNSDQWFKVKNYIQLLCDHMRSYIGNLVKQHPIVDIMANHRNILRNGVLGDKPAGGGDRPGRKFKENGMRIYDLEVKEITIADSDINSKLVENQRNVLKTELELDSETRKQRADATKEALKRKGLQENTDTEKLKQKLEREKLEEQELTNEAVHDNSVKEVARTKELNLLDSASQLEEAESKLKVVEKQEEITDKMTSSELARDKRKSDQHNELAKTELTLRIEELQSEVDATTKKATAVSPDLIAALVAFADKRLASDMVEHLGKLQFTSGESVAMILRDTIEGLGLTGVLGALDAVMPKKDNNKK